MRFNNINISVRDGGNGKVGAIVYLIKNAALPTADFESYNPNSVAYIHSVVSDAELITSPTSIVFSA